MTQPEHRTSRPSQYENLEGPSLESLASQTNPDQWQSSLLGAFMDSVSQDGMSPESFDLLEKMYNSAAATRRQNIMEAPTETLELRHTTAALGSYAVNDIEPISGTLEVEANDSTPNTERRNEHEKIVQEAIDTAMWVSVSGKFNNGVHLDRINDKLEPLHVNVSGREDFLTYSHGSYRTPPYRERTASHALIGLLRSAAQRTPYESYIKPDFLLFRTGFRDKSGEKLTEISFNRQSDNVDAFNRPVLNIAVNLVVPEEAAEKFQQLCREGDRAAIDQFVAKAAPRLKELEGEKHDIVVGSYNNHLVEAAQDQYSIKRTALQQFLKDTVKVPAG